MAEPGIFILIAAGKFLFGSLLVVLSLRYLRGKLHNLTAKTRTNVDDRLIRPVLRSAAPLGYLAAFLWGWSSLVADWDALNFNTGIDRFIEAAVTLIFIVMIVRLVNPVLLIVVDTSLRQLGKEEQLSLLRGLEPLIRTLIWVVGLLVFLQSQGVQMGAIYASLAGAGIGLGLALKGPISNFLNYFTILLDEPFKIGQFIRFDDFLGTVERVGIRSTAIRSLSGERVVLSNEDLLNKTIQNFGDLPKRRVSHVIGLVYQTPVEMVRLIPSFIEQVIRSNPPAEFDRCHLNRFGDSALEFEFVFYVPDSDMVLFLNLQQEIILGIMQIFQDNKLEFAYPTQTLFLESTSSNGTTSTKPKPNHYAMLS